MAASNNLLDGVISPAEAALQFLHIGTGDITNVTTGATARTGNGTQTGLVVFNDAIAVRNANGWRLKFVNVGTAHHQVKFPDADLDLTPLLMGAQKVQVPTTVVNSTVTPVALNMVDAQGNPITLVANATYEVIGYFLCTSAIASTGCRLRMDGPTGSTQVSLIWQQPTNGTYTSDFHQTGYHTTPVATGFEYAPTSSPTVFALFPQIVRGLIKMGSTVSADPLTMSVYSEIATSAVSVLAGSYLRVTRVA